MKKNNKGNMAIIIAIIILVSIVVLYLIWSGKKSEEINTAGGEKIPKTPIATVNGQTIYNKYCMACHGDKGDGNGIFAKYVFPKPRDFTRGIFKLRSTPSGKVPTDEDLFHTIKNGMPGTAMLPASYLSDEQIYAIIEYIKTFAKKCSGDKCVNFFEARKSSPIELPSKVEKTEHLLAEGKKFYKQVECWKCHGESGKGDGPQSEQQKDSWNNPIKVRDFTKGIYLGGATEEDLLKRFLTGMDGTPMPSFIEGIEKIAGADKEKQRQLIWGLVYYVKSLEEKNTKIAKPPQDATLYASKVQDSFNFSPDAQEWNNAKVFEIPLSRLWQLDENYKVLYVKALYNSNKIAILLEYEDKTEDTRNYKHAEFQDMVAIQFSGDAEPSFIGMGDKNSPVNIWLFKPNWQKYIDETSNKVYTNLVDDLPLAEIVKNGKELFYTSKAAGNLRMGNKSSPIETLIAHGAQTAESQPVSLQNVEGKGIWQNGKWRVIFIRNLNTNNKNDIQIQIRKKIPVAFAIWDGSQYDRNGQKFVSSWYYLYLE